MWSAIPLRQIGQRIAERRKALHLSQLALARRAQIALKTLRLLEKGKSDIRLSTLFKISMALQASLEELVRDIKLEKGLPEGLSEEKLPRTDKKLLELVWVHGGMLEATASQIAAWLGCSKRAVWDAVSRQERAHRLEVKHRRGRGQANIYRLVDR